MATPRSARNIVLLDGATIIAAGAQSFRAPVPPWNVNPRFQLVIENLVTGGSPLMRVRIEHGEIGDNVDVLYSEFEVTAEGVYHAYAEDLTTRFPFQRIRANVLEFVNITSVKATLVGLFDRANT